MTVRVLKRLSSWSAGHVDPRRRKKLMRISTLIICLCLLAAYSAINTAMHVDEIFALSSKIVGVGLCIALFVEAGAGVRNLLRADIVMIIALYGLTLVEFLFPQQSFSGAVSAESARAACSAVFIGFAGLAVGRHVGFQFRYRAPASDVSPRTMIKLFLIFAFLGYLHILLAVHFDLIEAIRQMTLPRFYQSWSRGRLGGVYTLLNEIGLLIFLIPPLTGVIFAEYRRYSAAVLCLVASIFAVTLFKGFSGGTRSTLIIYLITFLVAYLLSSRKITAREITLVALPASIAAVLGSILMLEFRKIGLSRYEFDEVERSTLFIDMNLINIAGVIDAFPERHSYLGLEIPYMAIIRPIPRAIWSGKPEGLSVGIEEALGAEGLTISVTFVGEAYMAGGLLAVAITAALLGIAARVWDSVGAQLNSRYIRILYASGFFAAALSMRSILQVAPAILPTLALWFFGWHFLSGARRVGVTKRRPARTEERIGRHRSERLP